MAFSVSSAPDGSSHMTIEPITTVAADSASGSSNAVDLTASPSHPLKKVLSTLFPKTEYMKRKKEVSLFLIALNQASALEHFNLEAIKTKLQAEYSGKELEDKSAKRLRKRVNCVGIKHLRPLHVAAMVPSFNGKPSAELVKHLLNSGADIKALADGAWTAMHFAACRADDETLEVLRSHCEEKGILPFFESSKDFCTGTWRDLYRLVTPETDTTVNFMDKDGTLTVHDTLSAAKKVGVRTFVTQSSVCTGDRLVKSWEMNSTEETQYPLTSRLDTFYENQALGKGPKLALIETPFGYGLTLTEGVVEAGEILCIYEGEFFPDENSASIADIGRERVKNGTVIPSVNMDVLNETTDYNLGLISGLEVRSPAMYVNDGFPNTVFVDEYSCKGKNSIPIVVAIVDIKAGTPCLIDYGEEHSVKFAVPHIEGNQEGLNKFVSKISSLKTSIVDQYRVLSKQEFTSQKQVTKYIRLNYIFSTRPAVLEMILDGHITADDAIKCLEFTPGNTAHAMELKQSLNKLIKQLEWILELSTTDNAVKNEIRMMLKTTNEQDLFTYFASYAEKAAKK